MIRAFGSPYPPGCSGPPEEGPCMICGRAVDNCVCPACPVCSESGRATCYRGSHGLKLNKAQLHARSQARIWDLEEQLSDEISFQGWLEHQPEDYTEELR